MKKESIQYIKEVFKYHKSIIKSSLVILSQEIKNELTEELLNHPEYENIRNIVYCIIKNIDLPKCKKCNKVLTYHQFLHKREYCSNECKNSSQQRINKQKQTVMKRYGVDCILRKYYKTKTEEEKLQTKLLRKQKNDIKKYGSADLSIKEKKEITMLQKYGVVSKICLPEVREKINNTFMDKYGGNPLRTKVIRDKIQKTCLKKYGKNTPLEVGEIRMQTTNSFVKNFYDKMIVKWKDYVIPLFTQDEYLGFRNHKAYKWKCVKCGNIFEQKLHITDFSLIDRYVPRCLKCFPRLSGFSKSEKNLLNFIKQIYAGEIKTNDKSLIKPYELDIVLPELKLAMEFNGVYWHSDKDKNYHLNKTELCESKGYRLIHIWQDEWNLNSDIIKDKLKSIIENKEIIEGEIFDRCWYSTLQFQNYEIIEPQIFIRDGFQIWNCGYIKI